MGQELGCRAQEFLSKATRTPRDPTLAAVQSPARAGEVAALAFLKPFAPQSQIIVRGSPTCEGRDRWSSGPPVTRPVNSSRTGTVGQGLPIKGPDGSHLKYVFMILNHRRLDFSLWMPLDSWIPVLGIHRLVWCQGPEIPGWLVHRWGSVVTWEFLGGVATQVKSPWLVSDLHSRNT